MATRKPTSEDLARVAELAKRWGKIIVKEQWGEQGPGLDVTLDDMEDIAMAAVKGMLAGTLESATTRQAKHLKSSACCPNCGRECPLTNEERTVVTRGGPFTHCEPKGHCPDCRRDFFPSASGIASEQSRLQPRGDA